MREIGTVAELDELLLASDDSKKYIIGAGRTGKLLGEYFNFRHIHWEGFFDRNTDKQDLCGMRIKKYDEINPKEKALYFISSFWFRQSLINEVLLRRLSSDNIVCFCSNDPLLLLKDIMYDTHRFLDEIRSFRNIHKGQKCFIIGNGPSLNPMDLDKIGNVASFGCNSVYALFQKTEWRPSYYFATDSIVCEEYIDNPEIIDYLCSNCSYFFTSIMGGLFDNHVEIIKPNIRYIRLEEKYDKEGRPLFSEDCSQKVFVGGTVIFYCIQMAAYMGFNEIFLLGVDCDYTVDEKEDGSIVTKGGIDHNSLIEEEDKRYYDSLKTYFGFHIMASTYRHINAYKSAKEYADANNIKIYNATRGGKLEVFERRDFDSIDLN